MEEGVGPPKTKTPPIQGESKIDHGKGARSVCLSKSKRGQMTQCGRSLLEQKIHTVGVIKHSTSRFHRKNQRKQQKGGGGKNREEWEEVVNRIPACSTAKGGEEPTERKNEST